MILGLYLLARVVHGKCKEGVTIFESQECNPVAGAGSIPQDQVLVQTVFFRYSFSSLLFAPPQSLPTLLLQSLSIFSLNTAFFLMNFIAIDYS